MYYPKDEVVASGISYEQPGTLILGCDSVTPWTWREQAKYNTQRDIDKTKAQQTQFTQVAELMGRQQQVNIVSQDNHAPQTQLLPQISQPQQGHQDPQSIYQQQVYLPPHLYRQQQFYQQCQRSNWQWDQSGHYYQQIYDNDIQQWYTVWWDYNEGRAYRNLRDEHGRDYSAWV